MVVTAGGLQHFLLIPSLTIDEARRCVPELTQELFDAVRAGRAVVSGDSEQGFEIEDVKDSAGA